MKPEVLSLNTSSCGWEISDPFGLMQGSWKTDSVPGGEHLLESGHQAYHLPAQAVALMEGCACDQGRFWFQGQGPSCGFHEHVQNDCSWFSHCSQARVTSYGVTLVQFHPDASPYYGRPSYGQASREFNAYALIQHSHSGRSCEALSQ